MNNDDRMGIAFKAELSPVLLRFKNPELERKYNFYQSHETRTPRWFIWLMRSFIAILIIRRAMILSYTYFQVVIPGRRLHLEVLGFALLVFAVIVEALIIWLKRCLFLKGFPLLVISFFVINYNSAIYYTNPPGMLVSYR